MIAGVVPGSLVVRVMGIEPALSAWELDGHASRTGALQVSRHLRLSVRTRQVPLLTLPSGTQRAGASAEHGPLLFGLGQNCVDASLIFCQAGTPGRVGLPLAMGPCIALDPFPPPGQQSLIFGVSVPRRLPNTPDEVLKLISRDLHPDPSLRGAPHLALLPDQTHSMTELPEPGVLARPVLPRAARPTAANGDLHFDKPLAGLVDSADPGDRAGIVAEGTRRSTMPLILPGSSQLGVRLPLDISDFRLVLTCGWRDLFFIREVCRSALLSYLLHLWLPGIVP
jgi:hypothetical protein